MTAEAIQIAKESKSSFYYAFSLLPEDKRDAMNIVFAFCRKTDDIVDEGLGSKEEKYLLLRRWRIELEKSLSGGSEFPLLNKLSKIIIKFNIPVSPFFELIKGMEMDLSQNRYSTFGELQTYCYRAASTVGLMCIEIFGYKNNSTKDFAVNLGLALQLTNILRDVKKDAEKGRIYLPLEDLEKFNYSEEELFEGVYNRNFIELMKYESKRAHQYFTEANKFLKLEDKPAMFPARAMQHIYYKLLRKLDQKEYDVFSQPINVTAFEKLFIALGVYFKYNLIY